MIRLRVALELDYEVGEHGCDFVFNIHAAHTPRQRVGAEALHLGQALPSVVETDPATGDRWYLFDPSGTAIPMGFVRLGTDRDAADVPFATIFGAVQSSAPRIAIEAIAGDDGQLVTPHHCTQAQSTDGCGHD